MPWTDWLHPRSPEFILYSYLAKYFVDQGWPIRFLVWLPVTTRPLTLKQNRADIKISNPKVQLYVNIDVLGCNGASIGINFRLDTLLIPESWEQGMQSDHPTGGLLWFWTKLFWLQCRLAWRCLCSVNNIFEAMALTAMQDSHGLTTDPSRWNSHSIWGQLLSLSSHV